MKDNINKPYYLVTFEGPVGSGKSYHAIRFKEWLENQTKRPVDYISNPYKLNELGLMTYNLMVGDKFSSPEQYALISLLNRNLLQQHIKTRVQEGIDLFVVDRWNLSFWTHQIIASNLIKDNPIFSSWALQYPDEIIPDVSFLLMVDDDELEKRLINRKINKPLNRYEVQQYSEKVRNAYKEYLKYNKDILAIIVKENESKDNVFSKIVTSYNKFVNERVKK